MKRPGPKRSFAALASAVLAVCVAMSLSSCASLQTGNDQFRLQGDMFGSRFLAMTILDQLRSREVLNQPIIVTTFVNLNNLNKSSVFGRAVAEKLLTELHQAGFTVSEIRKGKDIFLREELGELILTRDARETMGKTHARAVLAGTYVATSDSVIINARLIDLQTPLILSSCSYTLKMTKELEKLLTGESPF
jgi:TolB-like protein